MPRAKKITKVKNTKLVKEDFYSDILEEEIQDEYGNIQIKKTYIDASKKNKIVKEEIVNI